MMSVLRRLAKPLIPAGLRQKLHKELLREGSWRGVMDLRETTTDPLEAMYIAHKSSPVINVSLQKCRAFELVGCDFSLEQHPFLQTLAGWRVGHCTEYHGSPLQAYHQAFQPRDAFAVLGLTTKSGSDRLQSLTAWEAVLPWWPDIGHLKPENRLRSIQSTARKDMQSAPLPQKIQPSMYWFGPFPEPWGNAELQRLFQLFNKIREKGFQRDNTADGDIRGSVLVRPDGEFRVLLNGGQHRAAVAAALGLEEIPVRLYPSTSRSLVSRSDVAHWPQVRSGLFTQSQALVIFDRIFDGMSSYSIANTAPKTIVDLPKSSTGPARCPD